MADLFVSGICRTPKNRLSYRHGNTGDKWLELKMINNDYLLRVDQFAMWTI